MTEDCGGKDNKVGLGCGTLILIALIVLIFSGGPTQSLESEVSALRQEVVVLQQKVDRLLELAGEEEIIESEAEGGEDHAAEITELP